MSKVRVEAFMWGAGTALGELPPYFVARAHRLAGEQEEELLELTRPEEAVYGIQRWSRNAKITILNFVKQVGFFGILACASV